MTDNKPIKLIVGLGNPGPRYEQTRHNVGFWFVDLVAQQYSAIFSPQTKFFGETTKLTIGTNPVWALMPTTYMNESGKSVAALANYYQIKPDEMLIVHDELDLDVGQVKLKKDGGHAGHNGLRSIIKSLGNQKGFLRLRIGIGHPGRKEDVTNYVLGKPNQSDCNTIIQTLDDVTITLPRLISGHYEEVTKALHSKS